MNLQSIIDNSRARDNAVAELSLAINELDLFALERLLDHVASQIELHRAAESAIGKAIAITHDKAAALAHKKTTARNIARAKKGVRTRKANAKKKAPAKSGTFFDAVLTHLTSYPGQSPTAIGEAFKKTDAWAGNHLHKAKKLGQAHNIDGKWYRGPAPKKPIRSKSMNAKLNGAPASP